MIGYYVNTLLLPAVPVIGGLVSLIVILIARFHLFRNIEGPGSFRLNNILIVYFVSIISTWTHIILYIQLAPVFIYLVGTAFLSILMVQITFFHYVYRLTQQESDEKFSVIHYLIPFVIALVVGIWTFFIPREVLIKLVEMRGNSVPEYPVYSFVFCSVHRLRTLFSLVYTIWAFRRIYRYRQNIVHYSADTDRGALRWLNTLVMLSFVLLLLPFVVSFAPMGFLFTTKLILPVSVLLLLYQFSSLCYNFVAGNYIQIDNSEKTENLIPVPVNVDVDKKTLTDRQKFEDFMIAQKPYLNPQLKITDIAAILHTNRSYISSFINETYQMNFNQFINRYRLDEYHQLEKKMPGANKSTLAVKAGFGSYRSFLRIKNQGETPQA